MTKHTQGPWRIETNGPALRYVIKDDCNDSIAQTFGQPKQATDAALIASAPELLEALQAMLEVWEHGGVDDYPIAQARAAIAKATGETQ